MVEFSDRMPDGGRKRKVAEKKGKKEDKKEEFNVDQALDRLEEINTRLAGGEMTLQESIELYKEGVLLASQSREHLEGVEQELQIVNESQKEG